jgi:hypothetical protein
VPLVTDDVAPAATHHYLIEPTDPTDRSGPVEHAEYGGALQRGIVWTARTRLAAYGRTDATVVPTESGTGAVVSTVEPLSDDEVSLLLGVQGELALAVVGDPAEPDRCPDGSHPALGSTTVARRSGRWPEWGPVIECWSTIDQRSTYLGFTDEGDPNATAVVLSDGADVRVVEAGDDFTVAADFGSPPLASISGEACGGDAGCLGRIAVALDGTIIQPPGVGPVGPGGLEIAEGLSRVRAESMRAVLVAGGYPIAVMATALPEGTPDTMRPWVEQTHGSAPPAPSGGAGGWSGPNTLTVRGYLIGGVALGALQPMAGAQIEIVDSDGTHQAIADAEGVIEMPVPLGTVRVSVTDLGGGTGCGEPTTVVVLADGHHGVTLECHIK